MLQRHYNLSDPKHDLANQAIPKGVKYCQTRAQTRQFQDRYQIESQSRAILSCRNYS